MLLPRFVTQQKFVVALSAMSLALAASSTANSASLQMVEQSTWGIAGLPSYVNMYIYVPDTLAAKPPIIVGAHYCTGTAATYYSMLSTIVSVADTNGFILIFPEATGRNCWDVGSTNALTRDGLGDTHAIAQMVRYTVSTYTADANRVYVVGTSSGAMMTQALLGLYPDIFRAGAEFSGVPCGCWSAGYTDTNQWSSTCATGQVSKTGAEWGDLVRAAYPGYTGHRPRLQLWHGMLDDAINYNNFLESLKQWTNVLGLSETPTATDNPVPTYTHQIWNNACGSTVLEATSIQDGAHNIPFSPAAALKFFGLLTPGAADPEVTDCASDAGVVDAGSVDGSGDAGGSSSTTSSNPSGSDSGCGCRTASHRGSHIAWLGVLGLVMLGRTRRRR